MLRTAILLIGSLCAAAALAQYPAKPVRIVVSISAGGAPDLASRTLANKMSKSLGQPVIVENRAGANGNVAGQHVSEAAADGYTLLVTPDSLVVINKFLYHNLAFDPTRDFTPIASMIRNQLVLAVHPSVPANTLKEFVEYARKASKPIAYASPGRGSVNHLLTELFTRRAGIQMLHVPYKGGAPAASATAAGDTLATFAGGPSAAPFVRAGKLRLIAGTASSRWEVTPDLPVVAETYPGYEGLIWTAAFAPAATPAPIVARLHKEFNAGLAEQDMRDLLAKSGGSQPFLTSLEQFADIIRRDTEKYSKLISELKLTAEE